MNLIVPSPCEIEPYNSGAPAAPSGAPYSYRKEKETHEFIFFMLIMASRIARGRVRTTATTAMESRNMAAILSIIG